MPIKIRSAVAKLKEKEVKHRYQTRMSVDLIGYTLFGHLSQITIATWETFGSVSRASMGKFPVHRVKDVPQCHRALRNFAADRGLIA